MGTGSSLYRLRAMCNLMALRVGKERGLEHPATILLHEAQEKIVEAIYNLKEEIENGEEESNS